MRGPREPLQYGDSFLALLKVLKASQIKVIQRLCRKYLRDAAALRGLAGVYRLSICQFAEFGYRLRLAYVPAAHAWILEVVHVPTGGSPPPRARRRKTQRKSPKE